MSRFACRSLMAGAGLLGALVLVTTTVAGAAPSTGRAERGTVYFALTHTVGATNVAAGDTTDSLFGPARLCIGSTSSRAPRVS